MASNGTSKLAGLVALCSAFALVVPAAPVRGHAGDDGADQVHACVQQKNGKVRVVGADAAIACRSNETPLHFAIRGASGAPGTPGREGRSALTALRAGETVSGVWGASITAAGTEVYRAFATFPVPLDIDLQDGNQVYVAGESAPNCPGRGQAASGFLCVYQGYNENAETPENFRIFDPSTVDGPAGSSRFGFGIYLRALDSGLSAVSGTFSVTAP